MSTDWLSTQFWKVLSKKTMLKKYSNKFKKNSRKTSLGLIIFLAAAIGITLAALVTYRNYQPRALVSNQSSVLPPYVKLVSLGKDDDINRDVAVDIYLNTGNKPTVELDLSIIYDPQFLKFDKSKTENTGLYKTVSINEAEPGKAQLSLFVTTDIGQPPVISNREVRVARIYFQTHNAEAAVTQIQLEFDGVDIQKSALIPYLDPKPEKAINILKSAVGTEIFYK